MSIESCLVLHHRRSEGMQEYSVEERDEIVQNHLPRRARSQTNSQVTSGPQEQSTVSDVPRRVTDNASSNSSSSGDVSTTDCSYSSNDSSREEGKQEEDVQGHAEEIVGVEHQPLHEKINEPEDDFDLSLVLRRNRRVLLARLEDASQRGRLSMINLARRNISVDEACLLKQAISSNPQLSVLKLSYNSLRDEGTAIVASAVFQNGKHHSSLSVLDLGFNEIGDAGCEALAVYAIAGNLTLETLYLAGNQIKEKGALSIAGAILHGTGLTTLHLSANRIGANGIKAVAGAIAKNDSYVSSNTNISNTTDCVRSMCRLHLDSTDIEPDGFIAIPGMLLSNCSLRSLSVSNCNVEDTDMLILAQALSQNKKIPLEDLFLSGNQITCAGVESLMNAIWGSKTLKRIKLDNNRLQDRGAQLCAVVLTSIPLEVLDLSFNRITTVGLKALMKNISENDSLKSLGLCGITIDQNASKAVSYALAYNCSLQAIYLDNTNAGFAAQRYIVAGIVSNQKSSLKTFTGFELSPAAITLGIPRLPEEWCNTQVLGFVRLMWQQWLLKSGRGKIELIADGSDDDRGPAPPAAVAAAAKVAFASLGSTISRMFHPEAHEKSMDEGPPVNPASSSLLERSESGTWRVPNFDDQLTGVIDDSVESDSTGATPNCCSQVSRIAAVRNPLENTEKRNRNLNWLRQHFRALNDIGRLPFNNADLWQLHQYFFSPPYQGESDSMTATLSGASLDTPGSTISDVPGPPPPTPALASKSAPVGRTISFHALGEALALSGTIAAPIHGNKRRSSGDVEDTAAPASKRAKSLKPRIAFYPRIQSKVQSYGAKPMDQALALLRQLKYTENAVFNGVDPYNERSGLGQTGHSFSDVEMILLDLL